MDKLVFAYNCTRNSATSYSPFYLLFGRSPPLPIDFMFDIPEKDQDVESHTFVESWKKAMQEAYSIARQNANKNSDMEKRNYDRKLFGACLDVGDRVLVRNLSERGGTGKLRSYWEDEVHVVVEKVNADIPVYLVKREKGKGKLRTLHRNLLLPCDHLECPNEEKKKKPQTEKTKQKENKQLSSSKTSIANIESEDEEESLEKLRLAAFELMELSETGGGTGVDDGLNMGGDESGDTDVMVSDLGEGDDSEVGAVSVGDSEDEMDDMGDRLLDSEGEEGEPETGHRGDVDSGDDCVGDVDSVDDGVSSSSDDSSDEEQFQRKERAIRTKHPPKHLTYDTIGTPTYQLSSFLFKIHRTDFHTENVHLLLDV